MTRIELKNFIADSIAEQGTASSTALPVLVEELLKHVPCVVHFGESSEEGSYLVTDEQEEIDAIIADLYGNEHADVVAHSSGVSIRFTHIEASETEAICYAQAAGVSYTLSLAKDGASKLSYKADTTGVA